MEESRTKKASINALAKILMYIVALLPTFFLRKVFLDTLGIDMLGVSSLYKDIVGYLSLAEMGVGVAIIFSLYKPFAEKDFVKVKGYLNVYKKFYLIIGLIILIFAICLLPFIQVFIKNDNIPTIDAQIYFMLFLANTLLSYIFSYKLSILNVAQDNYKISIATTISTVLITILQIVFLEIYPNFYIYLIIQLVINLCYYLFLNIYIDKKYTWIKKTKGFITKNEKKDLIKNIKALFMHKIGALFVLGTDNIVISSFIGLGEVAKYNNYALITNAAVSFVGNVLATLTPSIGNLIATENKEKIYEVHKKLFFINFWIASFITISLFNTITQFITLWMGVGQSLSIVTIAVVLFNVYFQLMRPSVENIKDAAGVYYQDRHSAIVEGIVNLVFSLILVNYIGITGVFVGTLISNLSVLFWIKPKMVYKYVFNKPLRIYFKMYFKFLLIACIPLIITNVLTHSISNENSIIAFIINCIINIVVINLIYLIIFWRNKEFKYFKSMGIRVLKSKISKK